MTVWVVRAGRDGSEEEIAVQHGVIVVDWKDLPDLSTVQTREELRELCQQVYSDLRDGSPVRTVTQLWAFRSEIADGDFAILPLKTRTDAVAVGRVTSPYRYRPDLVPTAHHTHSVEWLDLEVLRSAFAKDFLASINVPPTVSRVGVPHAEDRLLAILDDGQDPGPGDEIDSLEHDRQSERYAESVFGRLYPEERARREVLHIIATSIRYAHDTGPSSWELTLRPASFMFNVGMVWVMSGYENKLWLNVDGRSLDPAIQDDIRAVATTLERDKGLHSMSEPLSVLFVGDALTSLHAQPFYPTLEQAHFRIIDEARSRRSVAMFKGAHSPGIVKYLRRELDEDIPDPAYVNPGKPVTQVTPGEWEAIQQVIEPPAPKVQTESYSEPAFEDILQSIRTQGMRIDERTLRRYHASLKVRGFVILSGMSGTGKSWLATAYARAIAAECLVVAVAPNWTSNEDLLGFQSPLDDRYHDTDFSRFLRDASEQYARALVESRQPRPFHLVLDEMNLARVEYYFAKFLSAMEDRAREGVGSINLAPGDTVLLAPNLFVVGTVNVDETTQSFADKVYDRAQLLELTAPREALWLHIGNEPYRDILLAIWDAVHDVAPFAFRIVDDIRRYVAEAQSIGGTWHDAFDEQLVQKILPKLAKSDERIGDALERCVEIARENDLVLTLAKVTTMLDGFNRYGFASYF
jgi:hypothetical protein